MTSLSDNQVEIDGELSVPIWLTRLLECWRIFVLLAVVTSLMILVACLLISARFESQAFISVTRDVASYNLEKPAFVDPQRLREYLEFVGKSNTPAGRYLISQISERFIAEHVKLEMQYDKNASRFIADKDARGLLTSGISFKVQSTLSGEDASEKLRLLASYITDVMLGRYLRAVTDKLEGESATEALKIDNGIINAELRIRELDRRLGQARRIASEYPQSVPAKEQQIVTTEINGRFLPPVTQIVGLETELVDAKVELDRLLRRQKQNNFETAFFVELRRRSPHLASGARLKGAYLATLAVTRESAPDDDLHREVINRVSAVITDVRNQRLDAPDFILGPTTPNRRSTVALFKASPLAVVFGILLAGAITLTLRHLNPSWLARFRPLPRACIEGQGAST
ncbi:hypothetical protein PAN31117_05080 [Pandoraea anapnoica]|uniref:Lipopolysaccharide biosynthesis protein n=1 Tax=Pandoraea anapnoica TaxID=2508301 RepID=A0A5E5AQ13_9BURK|nr:MULTISPECIES: hypothetical protein [Pandoraea]VVE58548.1 hypothetical protein PIN31009_05320 [Pandoraea iniqua]VVE75097.1 hypothetical protein PAN31117_05080 [Pandoraea anapnoica]